MATTSRDRRPGPRSRGRGRGGGVRVHPALRRPDRRWRAVRPVPAAPRQGDRELRPRRRRLHDLARVQQVGDVLRVRGDGRRLRPAGDRLRAAGDPRRLQPFGFDVRRSRRRCHRARTRRSRTTRTTSPERRWRGSRSPSRARTSWRFAATSLDTWAAVGRDPSDNVDEMRRGAIIVAAIGIVLGGLLLALAGWRSKRASTPSIPEGPGWGHAAR